MRYFPDGKITKQALKNAEMAARFELQSIIGEFSADQWSQAIGTSGTARSLQDILELNDMSPGGVTAEGLDQLRERFLKIGAIQNLTINGLRSDRAPVIVGGFAIMAAIFSELGIKTMGTTTGALREGVLWDLIGRHHQKDMRDLTVAQFKRRYHVDIDQAERVQSLAVKLYLQLSSQIEGEHDHALQLLNWAAKLHEIGLTISHSGYHKHSAYILQHADMPGFSKPEQALLARLAMAHRGNLIKQEKIDSQAEWARIIALRLSVLFHRSRMFVPLPDMHLESGPAGFTLSVDKEWLAGNPLTANALKSECDFWRDVGLGLQLKNPGHA